LRFAALLLFLLLTRSVFVTRGLLCFCILLFRGIGILALLLFLSLSGIKALLVGIVKGKRLELWGSLNILLYLLAILYESGGLAVT